MTEQADRAQPGRRRATRRRRPSLRLLALGLLVVVVAVGAAVGWLAVRGVAAKNQLQAARGRTDDLRSAILDGRTAQAAVDVAVVRHDTARAHALTSDPVWRVAGAMPVVGRNAKAVTTTADAVNVVAQQVLPVLVAQAKALDPSSIRVSGDKLDLSRIAAAAPALDAARTQAQAAAARAHGIDTAALPDRLRTAVVKAQSGLDEISALAANSADAARLMPSMLGADGPRRYFMAFQSDAEARATGGLIGAYGVLEADQGRLSVTTLGSRTKLDPGNLDKPAVNFGADYQSLYGDDPGWWVNTNLSPHFPYAAQLWLAMYHRQGGPALDGAIATDPVSLGYVLGATGPAALADGTVVTSANAASLTMRDVYRRFPHSDAKRNAFLQQVARAVVTNLLSGRGSAGDVARSLGRSAGSGRLLVYSTHPSEESLLETTPLGGSAAATPGPYVGVFVNNGSGSKLDYYLDASVDYALGACTAARTRTSTVTLTMTNAAPSSGLPAYVTTRLDRRGVSAEVPDTNGHGTNLDLVAVHLPVSGVVAAARIDGSPLGISPHEELGRPVVSFPVLLRPGQRRVIVLELAEPRSSVAPRLQVQPFATPATATVTANSCR